MSERIRVKMCGMTKPEDIAYAAALGVDAVGLIFASESSRCVSLMQAKKLLERLPIFVEAVAVLVNPSTLLVDEILSELPIARLQFHGEESPEFCRQFKRPYIKAMQVTTAASIYEAATKYADATAILLDSPSETNHGGTGKTFDWGLIPNNLSIPFILAGGLDSNNIKAAVKKTNPNAVDVCSGIELSPGIKDKNLMKQFTEALKDLNHV